MMHTGQQPAFFEDCRTPVGQGAMFEEELQGDITIELRVPGPIDLTERTEADAFSYSEVAPFSRTLRRAPGRPTARIDDCDVSAFRHSSAMRATMRRCGTSERPPSAFDSAAVQFTARPSRMAPARSSVARSLTQGPHHFRQADQRPPRGLASRICRWFSEHLRQFLVAVTHLHASHKRFPFLRP